MVDLSLSLSLYVYIYIYMYVISLSLCIYIYMHTYMHTYICIIVVQEWDPRARDAERVLRAASPTPSSLGPRSITGCYIIACYVVDYRRLYYMIADYVMLSHMIPKIYRVCPAMNDRSPGLCFWKITIVNWIAITTTTTTTTTTTHITAVITTIDRIWSDVMS